MFSAKISSHSDQTSLATAAAERAGSPSLRCVPATLLLFALACFSTPLTAGTRAEEKDAGRALFLESSCQRCHAVSKADVAMDEGARVVGPDLSKLPEDRRAPATLKAYLARTEAKAGKKHPFPWRGSDEQLVRLIDWLIEHQEAAGKEPES